MTTSMSTEESQSSVSTTTTTISTPISTPATEESSFTSATSTTEASAPDASDNIVRLQRIRTALSFILASYLPPHLSNAINSRLSSAASPIDFGPLNEYLKHIAALRIEALASRSLGDFSRKRTLDDEEAAETRAEKKLRLEEEEKKKKLGESKGVRDLKKVNTTGMKKMSHFFKKAAPKANV